MGKRRMRIVAHHGVRLPEGLAAGGLTDLAAGVAAAATRAALRLGAATPA